MVLRPYSLQMAVFCAMRISISSYKSVTELYWRSFVPSLATSKEYRLQYLAFETVLNLAYAQLILRIPEQALTLLHMAIEPILADCFPVYTFYAIKRCDSCNK